LLTTACKAGRIDQESGCLVNKKIINSAIFYRIPPLPPAVPHRDGKRFIVKADDLLTAFLSLERDAMAAKGANGNVADHSEQISPRYGTP
jgi:hypothetical protein